MKIKVILYSFIIIIFTISCNDSAKFSVRNKISNAKIEKISFGSYSVSGSYITNEESDKEEISDKSASFPKKEYLKFYLTANGNKVLLRTKDRFTLNSDDNKTFTLDDSTDVVIP